MDARDAQPEGQHDREHVESSPDTTPPAGAERENAELSPGIRQRWWLRDISEPSFIDVSNTHELMDNIIDTVREPLLVLDQGLRVLRTNLSFYRTFRVTPDETLGRPLYDLGNGQWDIPALRQLLENILPQNQVMDGYVVEHNFPGLGPRRMVLNARRIVTALGNTEFILLAMVAIDSTQAKEKP